MFCLPYITTAMQLLGWVFVGATPDHQCRLPTNSSISWETVGSCQVRDTETNITEGCPEGWIYDKSQVRSSLVSDWDMVCHREGMKATIGAAPMAGYLVGGLVFGTLTDKIGRKPTFMIANALLVLGGLLTCLAPEFFSFLAAR